MGGGSGWRGGGRLALSTRGGMVPVLSTSVLAKIRSSSSPKSSRFCIPSSCQQTSESGCE
eukprot:6953721-Prymnesium_polylepis.1